MTNKVFVTIVVLVVTVLLSSATGPVLADSPADEAARLAGSITTNLRNKTFEPIEAVYGPQLAEALPPGGLAKVWQSIVSQLGEIKSVSEPYVVNTTPPLSVRQPVQFAGGLVDLLYTFDDQIRLIGLRVVGHADPPALTKQGQNQTPQLPSYGDQDAFAEVELEFGEAPYVLHGTLTIPEGSGPFPVALLIHGSGPHDRDATIGPNKPFRDLAWGLASRGIAVFRYDKRTFVYPDKVVKEKPTLENEVIDDALRAVARLRDRTELGDVFLVGHSMGAGLAPLIASRAKASGEPIAGIVLMAGTPRPMYELVPRQIRYLAELDGTVTGPEKAQIDAVNDVVDRLRQGRAVSDESFLGAPLSYWAQFRSLDPIDTANRLSVPVLVLQGGRDYQVTTDEYALWRQGLTPEISTFHVYEDVNHLFISGEGTPSPAEYEEQGFVAEKVISDLAEWIAAQSWARHKEEPHD